MELCMQQNSADNILPIYTCTRTETFLRHSFAVSTNSVFTIMKDILIRFKISFKVAC